MKRISFYLSIFIVILLKSYSQDSKEHFIDTVNNIVFADYRRFNGTKTVDSLDQYYPNRTMVQFDGLSEYQRDSLTTKGWNEFRTSFIESIEFSRYKFKGRKSSIYFNLHFNNDGYLDYVLFNWLDNNLLPSMTDLFVKHTSSFDFSSYPKGQMWSQCATIVLKKKNLKNQK